MSAPVDGIVTEGSGHVNEAMLTGECLPVQKKVGDVVIAGSVVSDGALYVRAEKVGGDTMFSRIVQYVEDAQSEKAPIARLADRVAGVFVPAVICIALLAGIIWLCCGQTLAFALNIFTSVLVIACPCAMGLATPTAIIVGTGLGATHGILIRSAAALEMTHAIRTVVFDKTGTLTEGMPAVTDVIPAEDMGGAHVVSLAAGLEINTSHPLAGAVCRYAEVHQFELPQVHEYRDVPGMGVSGTTAEGASILVGSVALMADSQVDISLMQREIERLSDEAKTVVCVAENGRLIGILGIADALRSDAAEAVHALQTMGIRTVMITGDASRVASVIARQAGLDDFRAGVLPTQKADMICAFQKDGDRVMMVGDGINDAPALARADIGCAVGSGSDIAVDSAQIILLGNHLVDVPRAIRLSRQTMKKIKQNLFWAFCYNSLGIPVAAGVFYPAFGWLLVPMVCAAAMCLSSLFVVTNALSLRKYKL
ncbi:MAG: heavy metal translocating P-type ATPase, partial [Proteobacteria bacterium]|nr:heavy metal translocating P-type ATPase [Pseudomonadota bacterium]